MLSAKNDCTGSWPPDGPATGVKEKFGGLRVQVDVGERAAREAAAPLVRAAEAQVGALCEFRVGPGRTRMRNDTPAGWIKTVCDDCHRAWSAREIMIVSGAVRYSGRGGDGLAVAGVG
ncbi:hypothetical protein [Streptomyces phaeochromogenes]|uniref:hypothetical protein n=1 Tax=Streptomyces phaeochromogenes TaxID=1923 RepID=UPI003870BA8B|nr:hypothetical protein OHB08_01175 [Streptomyces phaeochromogenes]